MAVTLEELETQALKLSVKERSALAHRLIVSLDGEPEGTPEAIAKAWEVEIARRITDIDVGRSSPIPAEEVFSEIDTIIAEGHSRVPVYESSLDEVVGILYAKDLLPFLKSDAGARTSVRTMLRTPVFVPESMSIDDLLHEFQRRKVHLAIVLDEYGGTAGLVTIEDLLEEIVGEIQDEYDEEEPLIEKLEDDCYRVDGRSSVDSTVRRMPSMRISSPGCGTPPTRWYTRPPTVSYSSSSSSSSLWSQRSARSSTLARPSTR